MMKSNTASLTLPGIENRFLSQPVLGTVATIVKVWRLVTNN